MTALPNIDDIHGIGPARDSEGVEFDQSAYTVDARGLNAFQAGDPAGNRYVGIEVEVSFAEEEYTYLFLDAGQAELLAEQLLAAVANIT